MTVNLLDILILIPLLLWAYQGYKKGLIVSLASLAALVLGLYFALYFSDFTAGKLTEYFNINDQYLAIIAFLVTFAVVAIIVIITGKIVQKFIDVLLLGFLNKIAGAFFGILKGALYLSLLFFLINFFDPGHNLIKQEHRDRSVLYEPVESFAPFLYSWLNLDNLHIKLPSKEEILEEVY